jgi:hypothetical protein
VIGIPKKPADRNARLRELAEGEDCTVQFPGGACDPATVVWAHSNSLADQKGRAYKGHDSSGFFSCHRCHAIIDQPGPSAPPKEVRDEYVVQAQARTDVRLIAIATSLTMRPWKQQTARWALERRGINCD